MHSGSYGGIIKRNHETNPKKETLGIHIHNFYFTPRRSYFMFTHLQRLFFLLSDSIPSSFICSSFCSSICVLFVRLPNNQCSEPFSLPFASMLSAAPFSPCLFLAFRITIFQIALNSHLLTNISLHETTTQSTSLQNVTADLLVVVFM